MNWWPHLVCIHMYTHYVLRLYYICTYISNDCIDPHQINNEKYDYPLLVVKYVSLFWVLTILDQIRNISVCVCLCICSYLIIYMCVRKTPRRYKNHLPLMEQDLPFTFFWFVYYIYYANINTISYYMYVHIYIYIII